MPEIIKNLSRIDRIRQSRHVCFGEVTYGPGGSCGPRLQSDFQLVVLLAGSAQIQIGAETRRLPEGHGILMHPGQVERFAFDPHRATRHSWCAVHPSLIDPSLAGALASVHGPYRVSSSISRLIDCGLKAPVRESTVTSDSMLDHLGLALLAHCVEWDPSDSGEIEPDAVRRARELIDREFHRPLHLSDLARAAGTTANHLIRLFRRHGGLTPARHLWRVRTRQGIELLTRTGLSVSEIADRTGFANPFHFSRMVRKETGRSPRALRQEAWKSDSPHTAAPIALPDNLVRQDLPFGERP